MTAQNDNPGFVVDLGLDDDTPPAPPSLAQIAAGLDAPAIKPSREEIAAVERVGAKLGFDRREPQPQDASAAAAPITAAVPKPKKEPDPKPDKFVTTIRLSEKTKTRFADLCYERRGETADDTLALVLDAYAWARENGWEG